jgi:hypothetical protein
MDQKHTSDKTAKENFRRSQFVKVIEFETEEEHEAYL